MMLWSHIYYLEKATIGATTTSKKDVGMNRLIIKLLIILR